MTRIFVFTATHKDAQAHLRGTVNLSLSLPG